MQNTESVKSHLSNHKLRNTPIRAEVLSIFSQTDTALTHQDIENQMKGEVDRVTLYRTLQKFLEHGIIHQIEDGNQIFYALCSQCEFHDHNDNHIHFKCRVCESIKCLQQKGKIEFSIPKGYEIEQMKILLEGVCADCK